MNGCVDERVTSEGYAHQMADDPTVSVVIRALNEAEHLPALLDSLDRQRHRADEIVLVDSGSTDGTVQIAEKRGLRLVHIPPGEFTFGRALNWGCEAAKGDLLVFVSAHVYALSDTWLRDLIAPFVDERVGLSYGGQTGDHRSNFAELRLLARWFPEEGTLDQGDPFCNNANCAVRRAEWEDLRYDEQLPGLEDIAYARELRSRGRRIAYVPEARIAHVHQESTRQTFNRYRREALAYQAIFGSNRLSVAQVLRLIAGATVRDARAAITARRVTDIPSAIAFRSAQFTGAFVGHRQDASESRRIVRRMYYTR